MTVLAGTAVAETVPTARTAAAALAVAPTRWTGVCRLDDLLPERGAAALLDGEQVAVFRLADGGVRATANRDPHTGVNVMSRGIVGSRGDAPTVASPLHKQVYDLRDGRCLDGGDAALRTYPVRVTDGVVEVAMRAYDPGPAPA